MKRWHYTMDHWDNS